MTKKKDNGAIANKPVPAVLNKEFTDETSGATAPAEGQVIIYRDGALKLQVRLGGRTVWLTQAGMAALFQTTPQNITIHINGIYRDGEQQEAATCKNYLQVRTEGARTVKRALKHYNLDMILAVGYRVRSPRGVDFRRWATARLSELLVKGFTLDDERLKEGRTIGEAYFEELLERIRDIRASERMFYQKITDIYATSIDYDPNAEITRTFYAMAQNKLHWAGHGHTSAEIVHRRADAAKPHMGLTTWKNAPYGPIRKTDVTVAKNYLTEEEILELNRIVTMYLDHAEDQARRKNPMHMADWVGKLDAFLQFNERNILTHAGTISQKRAHEHAEGEFEKYCAEQRSLEAEKPMSDFDQLMEQLTEKLTESRQEPPEDARKAPSKRAGRSGKRKKEERDDT